MAWYTCADCSYMDLSDTKYGDAWCGYYREYTNPTRSGCSHCKVEDRTVGNGSAGCYLTTAVVDILGHEDHGYVLESLRNFRENFLRKDKKYFNILKEYDEIGPVIKENMENDEQKKVVANAMLYLRLLPIIENIEKGSNKEAIELYKDMVYVLKEEYNIENQKQRVLKAGI